MSFKMHRQLFHCTWFVFLVVASILSSADCDPEEEYEDEIVPDGRNYIRLQKEANEQSDSESRNQRLVTDADIPFPNTVPLTDGINYVRLEIEPDQPFQEIIPVSNAKEFLEFYIQDDQQSGMAIPIIKRSPSFTPFISIGALSNVQQFFRNLKENFRALEKLSPEERNALMEKHEQPAGRETRLFRPPATAAYLHAVRNQRPPHMIRNFVSNSEPVNLRGSNYYDPTYLWTGLGRRR